MRRFEAWLAEANTGLAVKEFPAGTRTATDAARAVGCEVGQIVKSLVFVAGGTPVVALVSGANRVDENGSARWPGIQWSKQTQRPHAPPPVIRSAACLLLATRPRCPSSWIATFSATRWCGPRRAAPTRCS